MKRWCSVPLARTCFPALLLVLTCLVAHAQTPEIRQAGAWQSGNGSVRRPARLSASMDIEMRGQIDVLCGSSRDTKFQQVGVWQLGDGSTTRQLLRVVRRSRGTGHLPARCTTAHGTGGANRQRRQQRARVQRQGQIGLVCGASRDAEVGMARRDPSVLAWCVEPHGLRTEICSCRKVAPRPPTARFTRDRGLPAKRHRRGCASISAPIRPSQHAAVDHRPARQVGLTGVDTGGPPGPPGRPFSGAVVR